MKYPENELKRRLQEGNTVYGPFVRLNSPAVVEIMGYAGFDFLIIDLEHGPMAMAEAENLVRAANIAGISPIIRVPNNCESDILKALDSGASGVQVPQINSHLSASKASEYSRFYPFGSRGLCGGTRAARYSAINTEDYCSGSNKEVLLVIHIEGKAGVDNIDSILQVPGIDVIFLGPFDLSQSLGLPGKVDHPLVVKTMKEVIVKANDSGKVVGTYATSVEKAHFWAELGVQYISTFLDTALLYQTASELVGKLKK